MFKKKPSTVVHAPNGTTSAKPNLRARMSTTLVKLVHPNKGSRSKSSIPKISTEIQPEKMLHDSDDEVKKSAVLFEQQAQTQKQQQPQQQNKRNGSVRRIVTEPEIRNTPTLQYSISAEPSHVIPGVPGAGQGRKSRSSPHRPSLPDLSVFSPHPRVDLTRRKSRLIEGLDHDDLKALMEELSPSPKRRGSPTQQPPTPEPSAASSDTEKGLTMQQLDELLAEIPEQLLVTLVGVKNLPKVGFVGFGLFEVYCVMKLLVHGVVYCEVRWPIKSCEGHAVWNSTREIAVPPQCPKGARCLLIDIWRDEFSEDKLLASSILAIDELELNRLTTVHMASQVTSDKPLPLPLITLKLIPPPEDEKVVFLVRHAESTWNHAQAQHDFVGMLSAIDHPLNQHGIDQALALQQKIFVEQFFVSQGQRHDELVEEFFEAQAVFSSPLTRAVQTALIATLPLLSHSGKPLRLMANAREKKNFGGQDTMGKERGDQIRERVLGELEDVGYNREVFKDISFDVSEVEGRWWNTIKEDKQEFGHRLSEFMNQIRYLPEDKIVVVGHSHFFREIFREYLHPEFVKAEPEMAKALQQWVVQNCGVLCLRMDFFHDKMVVDVDFLFHSELVVKKKRQRAISFGMNKMKSIIAKSQRKLNELNVLRKNGGENSSNRDLQTSTSGDDGHAPRAQKTTTTPAPANKIGVRPTTSSSVTTTTSSCNSTPSCLVPSVMDSNYSLGNYDDDDDSGDVDDDTSEDLDIDNVENVNANDNDNGSSSSDEVKKK